MKKYEERVREKEREVFVIKVLRMSLYQKMNLTNKITLKIH